MVRGAGQGTTALLLGVTGRELGASCSTGTGVTWQIVQLGCWAAHHARALRAMRDTRKEAERRACPRGLAATFLYPCACCRRRPATTMSTTFEAGLQQAL